MNFTESISTCLSKYATLKGRASRSEFWWFALGSTVFEYFLIFMIQFQLLANPQAELWSLLLLVLTMNIAMIAIAIPQFSASVRRLHDIGKSGWWSLLMLTIVGIVVLWIWLAKEGMQEVNEYGEPN
jgi:uncharacterized membrane protein YhaH (DUF805 family)